MIRIGASRCTGTCRQSEGVNIEQADQGHWSISRSHLTPSGVELSWTLKRIHQDRSLVPVIIYSINYFDTIVAILHNYTFYIHKNWFKSLTITSSDIEILIKFINLELLENFKNIQFGWGLDVSPIKLRI